MQFPAIYAKNHFSVKSNLSRYYLIGCLTNFLEKDIKIHRKTLVYIKLFEKGQIVLVYLPILFIEKCKREIPLIYMRLIFYYRSRISNYTKK